MLTHESSQEYDFRAIEARWQRAWELKDAFGSTRDSKKPKYFVCDFLPTPNGPMHMGHGRVYVLGDVQARYKAQRGFDVLHPMAFDSFGLPIEIESVKTGVHPLVLASDYSQKMYRQFRAMGYGTSFRSMFAVSDPNVYKWTQYVFTRMLEYGLAYRKEGQVSYCPQCNTSLAYEQVVAGGCWRCDTLVERRCITQWYYRITRFAQELIDGLDQLSGWPEFMRKMQINWIGRSEGAHVDFPIVNRSGAIRVFTTRIEALYGTTFVALSPTHPVARDLCDADVLASLAEQRDQERNRGEKKGVALDLAVRHPFTHQILPVYVVNYVQGHYGCGAVAGVPGHDVRDAEFAELMNLPSIWVTRGERLPSETRRPVLDSSGVVMDSGPFSGLSITVARDRMVNALRRMQLGDVAVEYRLHDWCISRQRYWGTPIPIVFCDNCGPRPVPPEELPVMLPLDVRPTLSRNPLVDAESFVRCRCPVCQRVARRETDTMDTYCDSSWYVFRCVSPGLDTGVFNPTDAAAWLPVDTGVGGVDAINFLLYTRFMCKAFREMGMLKIGEPISSLIVQQSIVRGGQKMSKRSKNVTAPDELLERYGADCFRVFIMFLGAPSKSIELDEKHVEGCRSFLIRLWDACIENIQQGSPPEPAPTAIVKYPELAKQVSDVIVNATAAYEKSLFNVVVQNVQGLLRDIEDFSMREGVRNQQAATEILSAALLTLCRLLAPIAPHVTHEVWRRTAQTGDIADAGWPMAEEWQIGAPTRTTVVQINGIKQFEVLVPGEVGEDTARDFLRQRLLQRGLNVDADVEAVFVRRQRFDIFNLVTKHANQR